MSGETVNTRTVGSSQSVCPPLEVTSITVERPSLNVEVPDNEEVSPDCYVCKQIKSIVCTDVFFFVFGALLLAPGVMLIITFSIFGKTENQLYGPIFTVMGFICCTMGCAMRISTNCRKDKSDREPRGMGDRENTAQRMARFELTATASSNNVAPPQYDESITPPTQIIHTPIYFTTTSSPSQPRKPNLERRTTASQINMAEDVNRLLEVTRSCDPVRWYYPCDEDSEENIPPNHISVGVDTSDLIIAISLNNNDVPPDYNSIYENSRL